MTRRDLVPRGGVCARDRLHVIGTRMSSLTRCRYTLDTYYVYFSPTAVCQLSMRWMHALGLIETNAANPLAAAVSSGVGRAVTWQEARPPNRHVPFHLNGEEFFNRTKAGRMEMRRLHAAIQVAPCHPFHGASEGTSL